MKLEVGMYVRTKRGYIAKCTYIDKEIEGIYGFDGAIRKSFGDEYDFIYIKEHDITKASHNIIDLIEEKDLLEIEYFSLRYEKRVTRLFEVTFKEGRFINLDNAKCQFMLIDNDWTDNDKVLEPIIKSIVTKQQVESMQYEVK